MTTPVAVTLQRAADYDEWRAASRRLLAGGIAPARVGFARASRTGDLFADASSPAATSSSASQPAANKDATPIRVPRAFPDLAKLVLCHRDDARFGLLYRLLWRLQSQPKLLENAADTDVWSARRMAKAVRRDAHKMKAFVRFRQIADEDDEAFVAWFEPEHHVVERTAPFFMRRFTGMRWSIVTPDVSAHWDGHDLTFGDGASRSDCPNDDALEQHWRVYYASIFNPARLKVNAMRAEMPVKYWRNLPESRLIPELTRSAERAQRAAPAGTKPSQTQARKLVAAQPDMAAPTAAVPQTLPELSRGLAACARCDLCRVGTAAVPGEGPASARLMLVGEQPGDLEDLAGRPFVGPAGAVLDDALQAAGIDRETVYLTNAVKHFKHTIRGKRRIHERPNMSEIEHCRWWLDLERELVAPHVTVALGATAARSLLGRPVTVNDERGMPLRTGDGSTLIITSHPAYLLRLPDKERATLERERFVEELALARSLALAGPR